jgi:hypothetical protein
MNIMSLDISLIGNDGEELYSANITHNLISMAEEAGIYEALWRPYRLHPDYIKQESYDMELEFEGSHTMYARDIIKPIKKGLAKMKAKPAFFERYNSPNGWGLYKHFVPFIEKYLEACIEYPDAIIEIRR